MQTINHWPDITKLALPKTVAQDLYRQLLEPFEDELSAKEFWIEAPSTLIILEPQDSIEDDEIKFALTYPEYTTPLDLNYQLMLAITNDSGSGIYLVIPPELSHIIP